MARAIAIADFVRRKRKTGFADPCFVDYGPNDKIVRAAAGRREDAIESRFGVAESDVPRDRFVKMWFSCNTIPMPADVAVVESLGRYVERESCPRRLEEGDEAGSRSFSSNRSVRKTPPSGRANIEVDVGQELALPGSVLKNDRRQLD